MVGDLDDVCPGELEDFRLVAVDGDTTVGVTDENKGVMLVLCEGEGRCYF